MSIDARIEIVCSTCKVALSVKAALAGKRVKCPKCGGELEIKKPPTPKKKAPLATERQKEFALELGIVFPDDITRPEISELIAEGVDKRDDKRFKRLDELEHREGEVLEKVREQLRAELGEEDERLSIASPRQMVDALTERGFATILILIPRNQIEDFKDLKGAEADMPSSNEMTDEDTFSVITQIANTYMLQARIHSLEDRLSSLEEQSDSLPEDE